MSEVLENLLVQVSSIRFNVAGWFYPRIACLENTDTAIDTDTDGGGGTPSPDRAVNRCRKVPTGVPD